MTTPLALALALLAVVTPIAFALRPLRCSSCGQRGHSARRHRTTLGTTMRVASRDSATRTMLTLSSRDPALDLDVDDTIVVDTPSAGPVDWIISAVAWFVVIALATWGGWLIAAWVESQR